MTDMPKSQNIQAIETGLSDFQQMSNCIESSLHQTENMYVTKHHFKFFTGYIPQILDFTCSILEYFVLYIQHRSYEKFSNEAFISGLQDTT